MSGPSGAEFDALARGHMAQQVIDAAAVQVFVGQAWDLYLDPNDLDGSAARFMGEALPVIRAGRATAETNASAYYGAFRALAGLEGSGPVVGRTDDVDAARAALYATGYGGVKRRIAEGMEPAAAVAAQRSLVIGAAQRTTVAAGRDRLVSLGVADPQVTGWARVSDGHPCSFCAMLIGRGPVYSARTVAFRAHGNCGCNVRLIPAGKRDPSGGWAPDARAVAAFALKTGFSLAVHTAAWRLAYSATAAEPATALGGVLATTASEPVTAAALRARDYALAT